MNKFSTATNTVIDPVCGMQVNPCKTDLKTEYGEEIFYFCCAGCLSAFQDNPEKFTQTKSRKGKGWWGRYLAKLNKSTDGKAIKCH